MIVRACTYRLALSLVLAVAGGCIVGPHYRAPRIETPPGYGELAASGLDTTEDGSHVDTAALETWWMQFGDAELSQLVERALRSNLDLKVAEARLRQAREQEIIAGSKRLPAVEATGAGVRLHANSSPLSGLGSGSGGSGSAPPGATNLKLYSAGFDATWELDIFGGVERAVEAARAGSEAAAWQLRDAQVSLVAEVANAYLTLRTAQLRLRIVQASIERQQELLELVGARAHAGLVTQLDVNQQRTQLATTRAQLPTLEAQTRISIHALAVLLAQPPETLSEELARAAPVPVTPPSAPVGLPSELLRRRPDIRAAERQLAAATAEIGVAVAELYPKFDLLGAASLTGNQLTNLGSSKNLTEVGLGLVRWPLLQGGTLHANVRSREAERDQAYLAYQKSVLAALQETEDALARCGAERRRLASVQDSVTSAGSTARLAEAQYRAGLVTFINVLNASAADLSAQDAAAQSTQALSEDLVSLYKALGGGWSSDQPPH